MPTQDTVPQAAGTGVASSTSGALGVPARTSPMEVLGLSHGADKLARHVELRDGTALHLRAVRTDDAPRLQAFHKRLSRRTIQFRFFGVMPELSDELAERLSHVDYENRMAVVGTVAMPGGSVDEQIVAIARYQCRTPEAAEIAVAVEDRWQGRGIGPQLLQTLAAYARTRGLAVFIAEVMYDNDRMLAMLRHSSFPTTMRLHEGRVEARLDISGQDGADPTAMP